MSSLRDLREPSGLSIRGAAGRIGISHDTLAKYEREGEMPVSTAALLAELYKCDVNEVVKAALEVRRCHLQAPSTGSQQRGPRSNS